MAYSSVEGGGKAMLRRRSNHDLIFALLCHTPRDSPAHRGRRRKSERPWLSLRATAAALQALQALSFETNHGACLCVYL